MEEILASIRRIISEDGEPPKPGAAPAAAAPPGGSDVLELTDMVEDRKPAPAPTPAPAPQPAAVMPAPVAQMDDGLMSSPTATAAVGALTALVSAKKETERSMPENSMPIGNGAMTLEMLIREEIRPILKQWLDQNLPPMVERLVQREIQRIARGAEA
jgi:cell pole-organizing protein PopZ